MRDKDQGLAESAVVLRNGTELEAQEWRNVLFLRYGLEPPDLPT